MPRGQGDGRGVVRGSSSTPGTWCFRRCGAGAAVVSAVFTAPHGSRLRGQQRSAVRSRAYSLPWHSRIVRQRALRRGRLHPHAKPPLSHPASYMGGWTGMEEVLDDRAAAGRADRSRCQGPSLRQRGASIFVGVRIAKVFAMGGGMVEERAEFRLRSRLRGDESSCANQRREKRS